jgi:hypothetical protein
LTPGERWQHEITRSKIAKIALEKLKKEKGMKRAMQVVAVVVLVAVIGVGCFYGGMVYGKGQTSTTTAVAGGPPQGGAFSYGPGAPGAGQGGANASGGTAQAGMLVGQVDSVASGVLTITDSSGKLVQIKATDTTLIQKPASVAITDLQKGDQVIVSASKGADGTYTARSIQVGTGPNSLAPANAGSGGPGLGSNTGGNTGGGIPGGGIPGGAPRP